MSVYMLTPFGNYPEPYFSKRGQITMLIPDGYQKCAMFVGIRKDGKFQPRATAFVVDWVEDGYNFSHLVTAEHVVTRIAHMNETAYLRANFQNGGSGEQELNPADWVFHPDENKITDVAVCPLHPTWTSEDGATTATLDYLTIPLTGNRSMDARTALSDGKIRVGDDICVVGLFRSHYGMERNTPIVRIGNISMLNGDPINTRKGFIDGFLIEARSIGGLSGSPVFVSVDGERFGERRFYLLGLIHGHFDIPDLNADTIMDSGGGNGINAGIGVVVPVQHIIEVLNHPNLVARRKKAAMKLRQRDGATPDVLVSPPDNQDEMTEGNDISNPQHREDFNRLVGAAAKGRPPSDQT